MNKSVMTLVLSLALARAGAAQEVDQARLRAAIRLPSSSFNYQFNTSTTNLEGADPKSRIAALKRTLHGDASDAAIYVKLGDIYGAEPLNDTDAAKAAYTRAVQLFQKQRKRQPKNGWIMAQLGTALRDAKRGTEAEKTLRAAVHIAPKDWRTWVELGKYIQFHDLVPFGAVHFNNPYDVAAVRSTMEKYLDRKNLPKYIAQMQKASREGRAVMDRAVQLGPNVPDVYEARAGFLWMDQGIAQVVIRSAQGQAVNTAQMFPDSVIADYWRTAALAPEDAARQGTACMFEILKFAAARPEEEQSEEKRLLDQLPQAARDHILPALSRLEHIAERGDNRIARNADAVLTTLCLVLGDTGRAEQAAKHILAHDSGDKRAGDSLIALYLKAKRYQDLKVVLEQRVKQEDTPYNRLMLLKANEHTEAPQLSEQVFSAAKRFPNDLPLNLAMVDTLLKQPGADTLKQAEASWDHAQTLFDRMSEADKKTNQVNMEMTRGAYLARTGKADDAKKVLQQVLTEDADNDQAKGILEILDGASK